MPRQPRPYHVSITRYIDPEGKRCTRDTPGAKKQTTRSDAYYADLPGAPRTPLGTTNEAEAWEILRRKLKEAHEEALGIRDQYSVHAATDLADHLTAWLVTIEDKGTQKEQVKQLRSRLTLLFKLAGWRRLTDIDGDLAQHALALLRRPKAEGGHGRSAQTRNFYLSHLKGFVAWCVDTQRLRANPVRRLELVNVEDDLRHARRAPETEEVAYLLGWLPLHGWPTRTGLAPEGRALGYKLLMATGLRAGEMRSLSRGSFNLDAATVTVAAGYSKRRRADTQHLPAWLVEDLRAWFAVHDDWPYAGQRRSTPGEVLRRDLDGARATWMAEAQDDAERARREGSTFLCHKIVGPGGPLFWDCHSFRHWYCTCVAGMPGMDLKTLLSLTRHSSSALALERYAHGQADRIRTAAGQVPRPGDKPQF